MLFEGLSGSCAVLCTKQHPCHKKQHLLDLRDWDVKQLAELFPRQYIVYFFVLLLFFLTWKFLPLIGELCAGQHIGTSQPLLVGWAQCSL